MGVRITPMAVKRVLVVDDDAGVAEIMSLILQDSGYEVRSVADARQVVKSVKAQLPDLVLLTIPRPGWEGHW